MKQPCVVNATLMSAMDIVEAINSIMDRNIVRAQVEVVGTGELQCSRLCNEHCVCGLQLCKSGHVCFSKTRFAWRGLEVFHLDSGIMGCRVGYLPKHLAARTNRYDGLCVRIMEIYSCNCMHCDSIAKHQKFHSGVGCCMATMEGMSDMFAIAYTSKKECHLIHQRFVINLAVLILFKRLPRNLEISFVSPVADGSVANADEADADPEAATLAVVFVFNRLLANSASSSFIRFFSSSL